MPRRVYTFTKGEVKREEITDENGSPLPDRITHYVHADIPDEDIRPGGMRLYAYLSVLVLPTLIDSMWGLFVRPPIKPIHDATFCEKIK